MSRTLRLCSVTICAIVGIAAAIFVSQSNPAEAADHTDPPDRVMLGDAADIGDLYAWHNSGNGTLTVVLTFAGPVARSG